MRQPDYRGELYVSVFFVGKKLTDVILRVARKKNMAESDYMEMRRPGISFVPSEMIIISICRRTLFWDGIHLF